MRKSSENTLDELEHHKCMKTTGYIEIYESCFKYLPDKGSSHTSGDAI